MNLNYKIDQELDLIFEKTTEIRPELIWKAWTTPEFLMKWFCPKPWLTVKCEMDLYPGGKFHTVMQSPEGQKYPGTSCILEVVEGRKLVWTPVLLPGFRPQPKSENEGGIDFTAVILIEPYHQGAKYRAIAIHPDQDSKKRHEEMGFHQGWGAAFDQLVELMKDMK